MRNALHLAIAPLLAAGASFVVAPATAQDWHRGPAMAGQHENFHPAPIRGAPPGHVLPGGGLHANVAVHPFVFQHHAFAQFTPAERAAWTGGWWHHGWWHGRWGWWWFAGGNWWWYDTAVYPYPTVVSDVYYVEPTYQEDMSGYWYYCANPPGYYPYVRSCGGPWQPVPPTPPPAGYDQGPADQDSQSEQGPPSSDEGGPPPGYQGNPGGDQGPPPGYDQGPPPNYGPGQGYNENQGQPPGEEQGPPPGQENGRLPNDQGPPPPQ